jgi:hypothetical protein
VGGFSLPVGALSDALALLTPELLKKNFNIARSEVLTSGSSWCGLRLSPFGTSASVWTIVPAADER